MKAEVSPTAAAAKGETKPRGVSFSTTPSRLRASSSSSSKPKDSETVIVKNGNNGNRVSPPLVPKSSPHSKPIVVVNKPKPKSGVEDHVAVTALGGRFGCRRSSAVVEKFARPRRQQLITPDLNSSNKCSSGRRIELGDDDLGLKKEGKELQEKKTETLIRNLQAEVLQLKEDLDKAQRLNTELQSRNRKLSEDLVTAEAKLVSTLTPPPSDPMTPTFKDIQKLIANKLEYSKVKNEAINDPSPTSRAPMVQSAAVASADLQKRVAAPHLPPPPPPLPRASVKATITPKTPVIFPSGSRNHDRPVVMSAHSSLVGEIQKRSTHLLAIRTDIETKGEFINSLIQRVLDSAFSDIEDVLQFVDWLDDQLSSLADERAVLKHFKWPEKKADAMREAAVEYRGLKLLESELSSHKDDASIPCVVALKKMAGLLDKSEQSIQRLIKLRTSVMLSYQQLKIPIDWMLDSGFVSKIKQASMMLAKIYLKRVTTEVESVQYLERESTQEGLLLQGIHFAYMVHQFAGGLDSETLCAFEAIRRRVPGHLRESRALLAGIPST